MPSCHDGAVLRHLTGNEASWYAPMTSCARRHLLLWRLFPQQRSNNLQKWRYDQWDATCRKVSR